MNRWIFGIILFHCAACASTQLTDTWKNPKPVAEAPQNVAIVGLTPDEIYRTLFEQTLKDKLSAKGIHAELGSRLLPLDAETDPKQAKEILIGKGYDSALVVMLARLDTIDKPHEQPIRGNPPPYYNTFEHYYPLMYENVKKAGAFSADEEVYLEANFYGLKEDGLLWIARSKTSDPDPIVDFAEEYAELITKQLAADGILRR